jgi:hypothetical protein
LFETNLHDDRLLRASRAAASPVVIRTSPRFAAGLWGFRTRPLVLTWVSICRSLVLVDEAAEDGPTPDPLLGQVGGRVVGPRRAEFAAAVGAPPVVMGLVLGQDRSQMPLAEDQHPVGDLGLGCEHEPFRAHHR